MPRRSPRLSDRTVARGTLKTSASGRSTLRDPRTGRYSSDSGRITPQSACRPAGRARESRIAPRAERSSTASSHSRLRSTRPETQWVPERPGRSQAAYETCTSASPHNRPPIRSPRSAAPHAISTRAIDVSNVSRGPTAALIAVPIHKLHMAPPMPLKR